jgi:hypothetical protein
MISIYCNAIKPPIVYIYTYIYISPSPRGEDCTDCGGDGLAGVAGVAGLAVGSMARPRVLERKNHDLAGFYEDFPDFMRNWW